MSSDFWQGILIGMLFCEVLDFIRYSRDRRGGK
jgi:hypothetical protein